ncbi:MAG: hypothetical protein IPH13_02365 [Planctomycetes bacterium]|nr:hypothetical protein [Planctomycetota bacterium]
MDIAAIVLAGILASDAQPWLTFEPPPAQDRGKHVVFIAGDEEYRSEESLPQLAKILAARSGLRCTVLFAIDSATRTIDPERADSVPGIERIDDADLLVLFVRFRNYPDAAMEHVARYVESGKPVIGLRTATHAFQLDEASRFARYDWRSTVEGFEGGFGRAILGETWIAHHGEHGSQGTRGVVAPGAEAHAILRGVDCADVWDPADVYAVRLPLVADATPLVLGEVLATTAIDAELAPARDGVDANEPRMPIAWVRERAMGEGKTQRVFTATFGSAQAFTREGSRRLFVNACDWALGDEDSIRAETDVALVGTYEPSPFGFGGFQRGVKPADLAPAD